MSEVLDYHFERIREHVDSIRRKEFQIDGIKCAYCDWRIDVSKNISDDEQKYKVKEHIEQCRTHPLCAALNERSALIAKNIDRDQEQIRMVTKLRGLCAILGLSNSWTWDEPLSTVIESMSKQIAERQRIYGSQKDNDSK